MCENCGCSDNSNVTINKPNNQHEHHYAHNHEHTHDKNTHNHHHHHSYKHSHNEANHEHQHEHSNEHHNHNNDHAHEHTNSNTYGRIVNIEQNVLNHNNLIAERNRGYFEGKNIFTINLISSPGAGKTTLLVKTIQEFKNKQSLFVIEGDQRTMNDANRINEAGAPVIQVNTGNGCHLDAEMINKAAKELNVADNSFLIIENVGNLVCPAMFDLGEHKRIVIISVTEGDDKPLKYPNIFYTSHLCIINKIDLLPYVDFNVEIMKEYALSINRNLQFIELSAKTSQGLSGWLDWLIKNKNY